MNRTIESLIIFCLGAGVGAIACYAIYKPIRDEDERDAVFTERAYYEGKERNKETAKKDFEKNPGSDFSDFKPVYHKDEEERITEEIAYSDMTKEYKENAGEEFEMPKDPYVINPIEYGSNEDYDLISLEYYADGILANEEDEIVNDADKLVGADFASHFGEYEEDSVCIRNERLKTDFEILYNLKTYTEIHEPASI